MGAQRIAFVTEMKHQSIIPMVDAEALNEFVLH